MKQNEIKNYGAIRLPMDMVEELRLWKQAFSNAALRPVSFAEIIRGMIDSLDDTEPDVTAEMDRMIEAHPEIAEIVGRVVK